MALGVSSLSPNLNLASKLGGVSRPSQTPSELCVTLADIQTARRELGAYLSPSPLIANPWLSEALGCELYFKLENMHPIGSFKIRGATYRITQLTPEEKKRGVIAASAGNHAQGVAWGAKRVGVQATIVMPKGATLMKVQNTRALGAEVILEGDSYDQAYEAAQERAKKTGQVFVPAFDDPFVVAGQGTVGLEILEQLPDVDAVIASVGGGGLMAGLCLAMKPLRPEVELVACQASGAPSMLKSIVEGKAIALDRVDTFADGIAVARASERIRRILAPNLGAFLEADDEAIAAAVLTLLEKAKIVVEGSGAVPLAVLQQNFERFRGRKVVVVISGGNIDVNLLSRIIDRGLTLAGRRLRLNVMLSDRPGSLARLTDLIAKQGANVLQAIHDRNEPSVKIDQTEIFLTLETRGQEHSEALIRALIDAGVRLEVAG
jgi:threonine dehydratase